MPNKNCSKKYSLIILTDLFEKNKGLQRKIFVRKIGKRLLAHRFPFCRCIDKFRAKNDTAILFGIAVQAVGAAGGDILAEQAGFEHGGLRGKFCKRKPGRRLQSGFRNVFIILFFGGFVKRLSACIRTKMHKPSTKTIPLYRRKTGLDAVCDWREWAIFAEKAGEGSHKKGSLKVLPTAGNGKTAAKKVRRAAVPLPAAVWIPPTSTEQKCAYNSGSCVRENSFCKFAKKCEECDKAAQRDAGRNRLPDRIGKTAGTGETLGNRTRNTAAKIGFPPQPESAQQYGGAKVAKIQRYQQKKTDAGAAKHTVAHT